jgi:signal transduction histidine kinase
MAVGQIAAAIAHEIRQPLTAIVTDGNAGLRWLGHAIPNLDEARAALERMVNAGQRAGEAIASIWLMFQKDNHASAPEDINAIIREVLTLVRAELASVGVSVRTELFDQLPPGLVNRVQLQQVIMNLIRNATDAMTGVVDRERSLRIRTEMDEFNNLLITVEDSGIGIDPKNIDRIFDAFFTTKPNGVGMGLAICRSIIESHGGRMAVSLGNPHGSIFKMLLPTGSLRNKEATQEMPKLVSA